MFRLVLILVAAALADSAQEAGRNGRVRFPSEMAPQMDLGPQLFESESQVLPMIIQGNPGVNTPHIILSKAPSTINPFGQIGHQGFSEGLIMPYYQPPEQPQTEFHQTMPPPLRATPYGPPKTVPSNLQGNRQHTLQKPHRNQERQPERHRFGPHRVSYAQHNVHQKPQSQFSPKQHRPSGQLHKDNKRQQPETLFKYSIVTNHNAPKESHPEQNYYKKPKQPSFNKSKRPVAHSKPHHSEEVTDFSDESSEFDQGIPDWQIKGNFHETPVEYDSFYYKKNKNKRPQAIHSTGNKHQFSGDFSFGDDFSDFSSFSNTKNNKRYPPSKPNPNYKRGEVKAVYEHHQEPLQHDYKVKKHKSPNHHDSLKSLEDSSQENFSGERYYSDYDFPSSEHFHSGQEAEASNSNFGSEWIPINAPEGVVPAKSYDIPPPDLSRGGFKERNIIRREYPREREDSNLVYGVQKPSNSEEVVSAVVRVKQ